MNLSPWESGWFGSEELRFWGSSEFLLNNKWDKLSEGIWSPWESGEHNSKELRCGGSKEFL